MSQAIPIKNLYHLLCYAWDVLPQAELVDIDFDNDSHPVDLLAEVLTKGTYHLLRRGIDQDYQFAEEITGTLRGRVDFAYSERKMLLRQGQALCNFDEISADTLPNQILKAAFVRLYRTWGLERSLRKQCGILIRRFDTVATIPLRQSHLAKVRLHRNNRFYRFLLNVCELVFIECLPDERSGTHRFRDFFRDEGKMPRLYEKFIFNFYKKKQSEFKVSSNRILWAATSEDDPELSMLPSMLTDVSLRSNGRTIIIDAKYYKNTLTSFYGKERVHSANLYQIFAYLKNFEAKEGSDAEASGILLYPVIRQEISSKYSMQGKAVSIETVDLAASWEEIESKLLSLIS